MGGRLSHGLEIKESKWMFELLPEGVLMTVKDEVDEEAKVNDEYSLVSDITGD